MITTNCASRQSETKGCSLPRSSQTVVMQLEPGKTLVELGEVTSVQKSVITTLIGDLPLGLTLQSGQKISASATH